jgi:hypothetical protein
MGQYENQMKANEFLENQVSIMKFTHVQALTMLLQYFKGGYFEDMTEDDLQVVIKDFATNHM